MTLEKLLSELHFDPTTQTGVVERIQKDRAAVSRIAETAYRGSSDSFPLCAEDPLTRLAVVTVLLIRKYDAYRAIGVSERIIFDTFQDVPLRADLYRRQHGRIGLSEDDVIWFRHLMNICIFQIGVLQFQKFEMIYLDEATIGEAYMKFSVQQKQVLPNGTPVINCHIQKNADLRPSMVKHSFEEAKRFFTETSPSVEYQAFLCYSWLLYPPMLQMLSPTSNIRQFAEHFTIIGACADSEQAMENLFPAIPPGTDHNPTSLQKLAKAHPERFGFGCGIRLI